MISKLLHILALSFGFFCLILLIVVVEKASIGTTANHTMEDIAVYEMQLLKASVYDYYIFNGEFPKKLNDLVTPPENDQFWKPVLDSIPSDPWGNEFLCKLENEQFKLWSGGPTSRKDDDIIVILN